MCKMLDVIGAFSRRFAVESAKQISMKTIDVVNRFVCTRGYTSCLEITLSSPKVGKVLCGKRVCVSPEGGSDTIHKSSDEFFKSNGDKFDVVIIDGIHSCSQVLRDVDNALKALNDGGMVLVRNCLPTSEHMASVGSHGGAWCGDVYRAAVWHFSTSPFLCYTVDTDYGCGIIDTACKADGRSRLEYGSPEDLTYAKFDESREFLLRVIPTSDLPSFITKSLVRPDYGNTRPLYVITPTGDRPECFAYCVDYMNRQTKKPDMWLIVDDGRSDAVDSQLNRIEVPYNVIKLPPEDWNTLLRNMGAALEVVPDSACVCIMEDDDWYPADYLRTLYNLLLDNDFVSPAETRYFHVKTRQYRVLHGPSNHGIGLSGPAIHAFKTWISSNGGKYIGGFDGHFGSSWCGTHSIHNLTPGHIVGFGSGRAGITNSHRIHKGNPKWHADDGCRQLALWIGDDAVRYIGEDEALKKVYIISNVVYPYDRRMNVNPGDLLVFLNKASSIDYYSDHENKVVYHRSPNESYGPERLCVKNRYVFGAGELGIPDGFIEELKKTYDWDYPIENGKTKCMTTGYMVAKYMAHKYPIREIVLVNFGYAVAKSTYRCPWHNWAFEARELAKFRHVFTADVRSDSDLIVQYETNRLTPDERRVEEAFTSVGSDRMTTHAYSSVFTPQIIRLEGRESRIAEVGGWRGSGVRAFMKLLPKASVYAVGVKKPFVVDGSKYVFGDGYDSKTWDRLPTDFDLIVDDGTHKLADMKKGIPTFLEHLKSGGVLMIEDVRSEGDVSELLKALPGAVCHRTAKISPHDDDRVLVYVNP